MMNECGTREDFHKNVSCVIVSREPDRYEDFILDVASNEVKTYINVLGADVISGLL
jgi:hypothetical protein